MKKVKFLLGIDMVEGLLVSEGEGGETIRVRLRNGEVIKRHKLKHKVSGLEGDRSGEEESTSFGR